MNTPYNKSRDKSQTKSLTKKCFTCQKVGHVSFFCYKNQTCSLCGKKGHTASHCRSVSKNGKSCYNKTYAISCQQGSVPSVSILFENVSSEFIIDSGSSVTIISRNFLSLNNLKAKLESCFFKQS